jgi:hypothetical protein
VKMVAVYPKFIGETDADTLDRAFERIIKALNNDSAAFDQRQLEFPPTTIRFPVL